MTIYINFGNKINSIRTELQVTQKFLGQICGNKSESYISNIEKGIKIPSELLFEKIIAVLKQKQVSQSDIDELIKLYEDAKILQKVNKIKELQKEIPSESQSTAQPVNTGATYNLETDALPVQKIPVISWVHAGHWIDTSCVSTIINDDFDDYIYTSAKGKNLFALQITHDCMEPLFHAGDIIVVDVNQQPDNGSYVVAKNIETQEATFKQFKIMGDVKFLHPLNSKYEDIPLTDKHRIIGKMVEMVRKY